MFEAESCCYVYDVWVERMSNLFETSVHNKENNLGSSKNSAGEFPERWNRSVFNEYGY